MKVDLSLTFITTQMGAFVRIKNFIIPCLFLAFALCFEMPLIASAIQSKTQKGQAHITESESHTKIHASDKSVLSYSELDLQEGEKVEIIQPSEKSVCVILIDSKHPTQIKGQLSCNGTVYLVNPKGIYVDKAGEMIGHSFYLIGSTALSENLAEHFSIANATGDVVNHGRIECTRKLHLIGRHVVNSGSLQTKGVLKVSDTQAGQQVSILHTGEMRAKSVQLDSSEGICELYGRIDTKNADDNQYGGKISILGRQIRLIGAYLDASGKFGGGVVTIGCKNSPNGFSKEAKRTSIDNSSLIDASSITYGPGGEVTVWSKELTAFDGEIHAKGGLKGGDGGLVLTSSKNEFGIYVGKVYVTAAFGQAGCWILAPLKSLKAQK